MPEKLLTPTQLFTLKTPEPANLNLCPPGIYKSDSLIKIENAPTNGYGILISIKDSNSSMITQIFFGLSGGNNTAETRKIYWRNKIFSIWGNWTSY